MQNGIPYLPVSVMDHIPFDLVWWQGCKFGFCISLPAGVVPPFPAWMHECKWSQGLVWKTRRWVSVLMHMSTWFGMQCELEAERQIFLDRLVRVHLMTYDQNMTILVIWSKWLKVQIRPPQPCVQMMGSRYMRCSIFQSIEHWARPMWLSQMLFSSQWWVWWWTVISTAGWNYEIHVLFVLTCDLK